MEKLRIVSKVILTCGDVFVPKEKQELKAQMALVTRPEEPRNHMV